MGRAVLSMVTNHWTSVLLASVHKLTFAFVKIRANGIASIRPAYPISGLLLFHCFGGRHVTFFD
jgi:hypothetical protein